MFLTNFSELSTFCNETHADMFADLLILLIFVDFLSVVLMLKFDGVGIASTDVVFYECGVYGRFLNINQPCSGCLSSGRACTWCIHDHQCKPNSTVTCEHNVQVSFVTSVAYKVCNHLLFTSHSADSPN